MTLWEINPNPLRKLKTLNYSAAEGTSIPKGILSIAYCY
jgi:hypothetical protein